MAQKVVKKTGRRENTLQLANFLNINGLVLSLGDIRKSDFSALEDPKASVKSLQAWAIQVSNILRGFSEEEETNG